MVEFACALKLDPGLIPPHINLIALLLPRGRVAEAAHHLESAGPLSLFNAHRIAEAIATSAQAASTSEASLRHFAQLASDLNADRSELKAILATLPAPSIPPTPTPSL